MTFVMFLYDIMLQVRHGCSIHRNNVSAHLQQLSIAADSLAVGDIISRQIRSTNNWSLLPTQAIFASVVPGEAMRGTMGGMIQFPVWLGKNSSTAKSERLLGELRNHMCLRLIRACGTLYDT